MAQQLVTDGQFDGRRVLPRTSARVATLPHRLRRSGSPPWRPSTLVSVADQENKFTLMLPQQRQELRPRPVK